MAERVLMFKSQQSLPHALGQGRGAMFEALEGRVLMSGSADGLAWA